MIGNMVNPETRYNRWKWQVLLATMACYLFYYCGRFGLSIALKPIMNEFGWHKEQAGYIIATLIWCYGIGQFVNGHLGDRFGRIMMPIGALVSCAFNWIFSFSPEIGPRLGAVLGISSATSAILATMMVIWGINGFFQAMGMGPGGRLISNWWTHEERGTAMGLYTFAAGLSNVTVFLLATKCATTWGWRTVFRYPPLLMAAVAVTFYFLTKDRPEDVGLQSKVDPASKKHGGSLQQYLAALTHGSFMLACASLALHHVVRWGLLSFMPTFFIEVAGFKIKGAGYVSAALPLGMAIGALSGGVISDKFFGGKRAKLIAGTLVLCSMCVVIMPVLGRYAANHPDTGKLVSVAMLIVSGFVLYASVALYFALCPDLLGRENSGTGIGIMDAAAYAGAGAGTAVIGWLSHNHGWTSAFVFMASCSIAGAILIVFLREDGIRKEEPHESVD